MIFCFIAGVGFLFKMKDDSGFALRIGIGTSMLISTVLFNISELKISLRSPDLPFIMR